jgi:prephenate dehydrogenase
MWRDICLENRRKLLAAVEHYQAVLERFRRQVASGDGAALERAFAQARQIKEQLDHP